MSPKRFSLPSRGSILSLLVPKWGLFPMHFPLKSFILFCENKCLISFRKQDFSI